MTAEYNNTRNSLSGFVIPELCNVTALSILILVAQLLTLVLLFAGGPVTWARLALMSLFVHWVALMSAGLLCLTRNRLAQMGLVVGALSAFALIMVVTMVVGITADRLLAAPYVPIDWKQLTAQLVISGIITGLALRYFYVQQQLRVQEQSELQARIQALQSRIRPHFLFNSMNIIASLIATDPETAEVVVEDLSELFRASLNEAGNQVSLADEVDLCKRYAGIEKLRLGDRLNIEWQYETIDRRARIPLLTLQPLLENAIYHGIQPLPDGGTIGVRLWQEDDRVCVLVDNPIPQANARRSEGNQMALNNIRGRLNVLYGADAEFNYGRIDDRYEVSLSYPLVSDRDGS